MKFDFVVSEITEDGFVAICLDYDVEVTGDNGACFVLNSSQGWISDMINVPGQTAALGETSSHSIPVGQFLGGKQVKYLAILQVCIILYCFLRLDNSELTSRPSGLGRR